MPGSKGLNPHELAHRWMKDLGTRSDMEHKSGMIIPRYANTGEDCGSATHGTIRRHHSWGLLTPTSLYQKQKKGYGIHFGNHILLFMSSGYSQSALLFG